MRTRTSGWRTFAAAGFLTVAAFLVMASCATIPHDPLYDGGEPIIEIPDSTTLVRLTILNNRVQDALDPHFYLLGTGRHSLGIVPGMGGKREHFVDTRWFAPDGCMVVIAHYVGLGDWTSQRFCWRSGEVIDVSLQAIMSTSTAWSHR